MKTNNNIQFKTATLFPKTRVPKSVGNPVHVGTWSYDIRSDTMLWSDAVYDLHDVPATFIPTLRRMCDLTIPGLDEAETAFDLALSDGSGFECEYAVRLQDTSLRWLKTSACVHIDKNGPARLLGTIRDVTPTADVKPAQSGDSHRIADGPAPKFTAVEDIIRRARIVAEGCGQEYGVYCISLPGREAGGSPSLPGDVVIDELIDRIRRIMPEQSQVMALDGDRIVALVECLGCDSEITQLADCLRAEIERPIASLDGDIEIRPCLDIVRGSGETARLSSKPDDAVRGDRNLRQSATQKHSQFAREIRDAQRFDQFVVAYQPKIDFRKNSIAGFEALIRWQHPVKGLLEPAAFHFALADPELESDLSELILQKVMKQLASWSDTGINFRNVAVNLAGGQLLDAGFFNRFVAMTEENAILPSQLKLEIGEDVLLSDCDHTISRTLNCMQQAGFSTALDDFGCGNASWSDISGFSVDRLKIDRSLVTNLLEDTTKKTLVRSIIDLAHDLDLEVIAEGIETASVDRTLKTWGCDVGQGFAYARPMLACAVPGFIERWRKQRGRGSHLHLVGKPEHLTQTNG